MAPFDRSEGRRRWQRQLVATVLLLLPMLPAAVSKATTSRAVFAAFVATVRRHGRPSTRTFLSAADGAFSLDRLSLTEPVLRFRDGLPDDSRRNPVVVVVGQKTQIELCLPSLLGDSLARTVVDAMLQSVSDDRGGTASTWIAGDVPREIVLCAVPSKLSRNNHPLAVHSVTDMLSGKIKKDSGVVLLVQSPETDVGPLSLAATKAVPVFTRKTGNSSSGAENSNDHDDKCNDSAKPTVAFFDTTAQSFVDDERLLEVASAVSCSVSLATALVDMPPDQLNTNAFSAVCQRIDNVRFTEIVADNLAQQGFGGIYSVGKAGIEPPRLVKLEYTPDIDANANASPIETVALVGKGIVYDTGGLSLKPKTGMSGMKHDMGGAAGMLGGFLAAVRLGVPKKITLLLCLAENSIGPNAFRNDDIIRMYSGKTVEVNNCDAEGRLVLGDGVAYATKHIADLDWVMDMATLTGAQLVTTGKKHAGILANTAELEQRALRAGMQSGDLTYPMLYCPELLMDEFRSEVADMKNSVKDRSNAQSSCAGHFIESHLDSDYKGGWLHVDMAGPGTKGERGTGYGVGLVLSMLEADGFRST